jgi:hypothetical protein
MALTRDAVFDRILVDHVVRGGTRISWSVRYTFHEPHPWLFSVEVGHTGDPNADDWVALAAPAPDIVTITDPVRRLSGTNPVTHYRVVLTTPTATHRSEPQSVYGILNKHDWLEAREIVRGFELFQDRRHAVPGWLYKRKREGLRQADVDAHNPLKAIRDPLTGSVRRRRNDVETYGTGFEGGYYTPFPLKVAMDPAAWDEETEATLSEGNTDPSRIMRQGMALLVPPLAAKDLFVAAGGDMRYEVGVVNVAAAIGDIPLFGTIKLTLLPFDDVDYELPAPPSPPISG